MPSAAVDQYVQVTTNVVVALAAESKDALRDSRKSPDIWHDDVALHQHKHAEYPADAIAAERKRVQKRLKYYRMEGDTLHRLMPDGSTRIVPKPADRTSLIEQHHTLCGHFGVRRTAALVQTSYWWRGLLPDVAEMVRKCALCDRTQVSFNARSPVLQPLPINGISQVGC
eukprot:jgi/Chrzof1/2827/Cz12g00090.t1